MEAERCSLQPNERDGQGLAGTRSSLACWREDGPSQTGGPRSAGRCQPPAGAARRPSDQQDHFRRRLLSATAKPWRFEMRGWREGKAFDQRRDGDVLKEFGQGRQRAALATEGRQIARQKPLTCSAILTLDAAASLDKGDRMDVLLAVVGLPSGRRARSICLAGRRSSGRPPPRRPLGLQAAWAGPSAQPGREGIARTYTDWSPAPHRQEQERSWTVARRRLDHPVALRPCKGFRDGLSARAR